MIDAYNVLVDDRSVVELLGDVMGRCPDQLDTALARAAVRIGAGERGQERIMDVDRLHTHPLQEVAAEDLHIARQHQQLGIAAQELEQSHLGLLLAALRHRHVVEGDSRGERLGLDVGVVGDHRHDLRVQLTTTPTPQQLLQAMAVARDQNRDALSLSPPTEPPVDLKPRGNLFDEFPPQTLMSDSLSQEELGAQEEPPTTGIRGVLMGGDDVRAPLEQKARHSGDDPRKFAADWGARGGMPYVFVRSKLEDAARASTKRSTSRPARTMFPNCQRQV